jgi:hypothetical protein
MFNRYNIASEADLRMATQKTTMYVDTAKRETSDKWSVLLPPLMSGRWNCNSAVMSLR